MIVLYRTFFKKHKLVRMAAIHILLLFVLEIGGCGTQNMAKLSSTSNNQYEIVAFVDVNVVPMDSELIVRDRTVIVQNGIITSINKNKEANIPEDAFIIDGHGKYLMPGLADMHVHIGSEKDLLLFVSHGVLTVQIMMGSTGFVKLLGFPDPLDLRDSIHSGELIGPTIYTAGSALEGKPRTQPFMYEVTSEKKAEKAVLKQIESGYDFIKVYDNLTPQVYESIIKVAKQQGIPVKGHVPKAVGIDRVLFSG